MTDEFVLDDVATPASIATDYILDKIRGESYSPTSLDVQRKKGFSNPTAVRLSGDGEDNQAGVLEFDENWFGMAEKLTLTGADSNANRATLAIERDFGIGPVLRVGIDLDSDGNTDSQLTYVNDRFGRPTSIEIDINNDGKSDAELRVKRNWIGFTESYTLEDASERHQFNISRNWLSRAMKIESAQEAHSVSKETSDSKAPAPDENVAKPDESSETTLFEPVESLADATTDS